MTVKEFIQKLSAYNPEAEVVRHNYEEDFFYEARLYTPQGVMHDDDRWVNLNNRSKPKYYVLVG